VAERGDDPGFVVRADRRHPVAEALPDLTRVFDETVHRVAVRPAALCLQRSRKIPMVQCQVRLDATQQQAIDEPFVEVQAL